jgi:hypothetical protein
MANSMGTERENGSESLYGLWVCHKRPVFQISATGSRRGDALRTLITCRALLDGELVADRQTGLPDTTFRQWQWDTNVGWASETCHEV